MTADKLQQNIVLRLANSGWCRYWLNFNHPSNPRQMAIQVIDESGKPKRVKDIEQLGFELYSDSKTEPCWIYTIPRTNKDGTPYVSHL